MDISGNLLELENKRLQQEIELLRKNQEIQDLRNTLALSAAAAAAVSSRTPTSQVSGLKDKDKDRRNSSGAGEGKNRRVSTGTYDGKSGYFYLMMLLSKTYFTTSLTKKNSHHLCINRSWNCCGSVVKCPLRSTFSWCAGWSPPRSRGCSQGVSWLA